MQTQATSRTAAGSSTVHDLVQVRAISKRFGSTVALDQVSLDGRAGSIHAITGENGAGKSTLMKLLAGVYRADEGKIVIDGQARDFHGPAAARAAGVSTVFQELTVLPNLTVCENLMLGREPARLGMLGRGAMLREAQAVLTRIGIDLDPRRYCGSLTVGEQQLVEIAKGVSTDARVFIFDEPSAALNRAEVDKLETLIAALKAQGKLVFYISHRLDEILRLCDTVTVLKDGKRVTTEPVERMTTERLVTLMVGRPLQALFPARRQSTAGSVALDVRSLTPVAGGPVARFTLRHGEIVGLGGLEGQGQREIVRALAGVQRPFESDVWRVRHDVAVKGTGGEPRRYEPRDGVVKAVEEGIGLVPEDRKLEGLYLELPISGNIGVGQLRGMGLLRNARRDPSVVVRVAQRMQLRCRDLAQEVGALSGGNQQKVMLGRWLAAGVDTLLVEQPTRGVDVGAKAEIYQLLREFASQGGAVLAVSSDLLELIGLCDRILMVRGGRIAGEVDASVATEEGLLALALSGPATSPADDVTREPETAA